MLRGAQHVSTLKKFGRIKSENIPNMPKGTIVVIKNEKQQEITVSDYHHFVNTVITMDDIDVDESLKRKLVKLTEIIETPDLSGVEKDIVLATPIELYQLYILFLPNNGNFVTTL